VTSYERLKLRLEVAEKALALQAEDTPANQVALHKALNDYEAATNDLGSAVAKALLGRNSGTNLLADDSVRKSLDDPDTAPVGDRIRLRNDGKTEFPKVRLNSRETDHLKPIPKLNAPGLYPAEED
jgi:hypothetical protein